MKRITILLIALLALVLSACGSGEPSEAGASEPVATVEPTPEPTPEPDESAESEASADTGDDAALVDLLPDEINGQARVDLTDNPMFGALLEAQSIDASGVEYVVSTYGSGEGALAVTAIRIPDMDEPELKEMAQLMSGMAAGEGSAETQTIGGKEVLVITAAEAEQTGYMYFLEGAVIVVGGTSPDLAEEFFSQLP